VYHVLNSPSVESLQFLVPYSEGVSRQMQMSKEKSRVPVITFLRLTSRAWVAQ